MPGAVSLFARAYQRQIGGNLTGSAATKALRKAMADRKVTGSILTVAGDLAAETAAPSLEPAKLASQAEQARYQNAVSDLAVVASNAGVEEGFARIFRTLNAGLSESNGLVEALASGFNSTTKFADDLLLFPQSFIRALQGRNSVVADFLGVEATKQLQADWAQILSSLETISTIGTPSWLPTLESTSRDIAAQFRIIAQLASGDFSNLGQSLQDFTINRYSNLANAYASGPNLALRAVGTALGTSVPQIGTNGITYFAPKSVEELYGLGRNPSNGDPTSYNLFGNEELGIKEGNSFGQKPAGIDYNLPSSRYNRNFIGNDPSALFYKDPTTYDQEQRDRALARQEDSSVGNTYTNTVSVQLNVDAATLSVMDIESQAQELTERFARGLEEVLTQFPQKE